MWVSVFSAYFGMRRLVVPRTDEQSPMAPSVSTALATRQADFQECRRWPSRHRLADTNGHIRNDTRDVLRRILEPSVMVRRWSTVHHPEMVLRKYLGICAYRVARHGVVVNSRGYETGTFWDRARPSAPDPLWTMLQTFETPRGTPQRFRPRQAAPSVGSRTGRSASSMSPPYRVPWVCRTGKHRQSAATSSEGLRVSAGFYA